MGKIQRCISPENTEVCLAPQPFTRNTYAGTQSQTGLRGERGRCGGGMALAEVGGRGRRGVGGGRRKATMTTTKKSIKMKSKFGLLILLHYFSIIISF